MTAVLIVTGALLLTVTLISAALLGRDEHRRQQPLRQGAVRSNPARQQQLQPRPDFWR